MKTKCLSRFQCKTTLPYILVLSIGTTFFGSCTQENIEADAGFSAKIYSVVDKMPEYPGGLEAMFNYIQSAMKYPEEARKLEIQGTVKIHFVINSQGEIVNIEVAKGVHQILDEEAMRVINNMPDWLPGYQDGIAVNVRYTLPVSFVLNSLSHYTIE